LVLADVGLLSKSRFVPASVWTRSAGISQVRAFETRFEPLLQSRPLKGCQEEWVGF
jgi:hypothetical protein